MVHHDLELRGRNGWELRTVGIHFHLRSTSNAVIKVLDALPMGNDLLSIVFFQWSALLDGINDNKRTLRDDKNEPCKDGINDNKRTLRDDKNEPCKDGINDNKRSLRDDNNEPCKDGINDNERYFRDNKQNSLPTF
ncbi:hypothetical protein CEXT_811501 [Caerostris extrusa]|uniref:Uncharacterized protein n=1 Tax=Caerostris extrusa TaxID=172846 RepID=A0AAV4WXR8_CAEEX|nr:hypothetical protein CEXT_811501 [Caerostris extrusa]